LKNTVAAVVEQCQPRRAPGLLPFLGAVALGFTFSACDPPEPTASATLKEFYDAVQEQDFDRLYCLMAGAAEATELGTTDAERRAGFRSWAADHYEAYESGRDAGRVEVDEQGLVLVKLFSLGRGTFVTHENAGPAGPDAVVVEGRIRFGYAHIDLSPFSPGTTFYVCGAPVGRVHPVRVPIGAGEATVDALDGVSVLWTLVPRSPTEACPGSWAVASAEPVEGSATTTEITWVF